MNYSKRFTLYSRKVLMQKVQMRMSKQRFQHVLGVEKTAIALAKKYGCSPEKASIAALTHDYAKERPDDEFIMVIKKDGYDGSLLDYDNAIWHGIVGASFVRRELSITDEEILHAIRVHTTGASDMSLLDKIIYVSDYIEPGRTFPGVQDAREIAMIDLDEAVSFEIKHTLSHLIKQGRKVYPKTLETYNYWVVKNRNTIS